MRAVRLPFGLWLVRDTTVPSNLPPLAREQATRLRLDNLSLRQENAQLMFYPKASDKIASPTEEDS